VRYIHFTNVAGNNNDTLITYDIIIIKEFFNKNNNIVDICIAMNGNDAELFSSTESKINTISQLIPVKWHGKIYKLSNI